MRAKKTTLFFAFLTGSPNSWRFNFITKMCGMNIYKCGACKFWKLLYRKTRKKHSNIVLSVLTGSPKSPDFLMAKFEIELLGEKYFTYDRLLNMHPGTVKDKSQVSLYYAIGISEALPFSRSEIIFSRPT